MVNRMRALSRKVPTGELIYRLVSASAMESPA